MSKVTTDMIRNIALIGHSGEGKTSLAEAMLFNAKSIDRLGKVEDGNTTMDFDAEEINRKISIRPRSRVRKLERKQNQHSRLPRLLRF